MEKSEKLLLHQLEAEGEEIACCHKELNDIINSGKKINCSKLLRICKKLNEHIDTFDKIDEMLSKSENIRLSLPKLKAAGM